VLTPSYAGIEKTLDLPQASTLCGECHVVCPVKIPLPDLLRKLREKQVERHLRPPLERAGLRLWAYLARRPKLYRLAASGAVRFLRLLGGRRKSISRLPLAGGWTNYREMPAPPGKTFHEMYRQRQG
jgi:L-lactate dehydrogenase complex protein LldF